MQKTTNSWFELEKEQKRTKDNTGHLKPTAWMKITINNFHKQETSKAISETKQDRDSRNQNKQRKMSEKNKCGEIVQILYQSHEASQTTIIKIEKTIYQSVEDSIGPLAFETTIEYIDREEASLPSPDCVHHSHLFFRFLFL